MARRLSGWNTSRTSSTKRDQRRRSQTSAVQDRYGEPSGDRRDPGGSEPCALTTAGRFRASLLLESASPPLTNRLPCRYQSRHRADGDEQHHGAEKSGHVSSRLPIEEDGKDLGVEGLNG